MARNTSASAASAVEARQAFLQLLMSRKVMTHSQAANALAMISEELNVQDQLDVKSCLANLNKELQHCNLQIRGMVHQDSEAYAVVNVLSDDVSKMHASKMKDWEKAYFKEVIKAICGRGGDFVEDDELTALRVPIGGTAASVREKRSVLSLLSAEFWLQRDKHGRFALGPRTFLELDDFVRANEMEMPQVLYY
ncbi:hypothetical protein NSK_002158 [Nannochloropsis salina CCMP1776]|uniref:Non-structural maintenance of chromosomes element 1 homolog n=1 Tax=Nannochloropsis salina CCMP1776 TaxID=1027361 RepID=A0A4D9D434_9STRA|nr:hypothetical protein NSK_002158 [Nannochloropsis salina CCMP1776]|eukprot:TFJ86501.1 hypothetical protein NSK_002158 [Nannochloropsis salina CCMP1776]